MLIGCVMVVLSCLRLFVWLFDLCVCLCLGLRCLCLIVAILFVELFDGDYCCDLLLVLVRIVFW